MQAHTVGMDRSRTWGMGGSSLSPHVRSGGALIPVLTCGIPLDLPGVGIGNQVAALVDDRRWVTLT